MDQAQSMFFVHFGQFVDHDMTLVPESDTEMDCCDDDIQVNFTSFISNKPVNVLNRRLELVKSYVRLISEVRIT